MPDLPSHASPTYTPPPDRASDVDPLSLSHAGDAPPPSLLSPAFTPSTSGVNTPYTEREPRSVPIDASNGVRPKLLTKLPTVQCVVRARIPTVGGAEMFLHLYANNIDDKEHLAIVFSDNIRSRSLDAPVPGETERDRMIRGAYVGRLHPGRMSSRRDDADPHGTESVEERALIKAPLVRIHSECYTGETAWSARCDCGEQLDEAARLMSRPDAGGGAIIYLRQEGRGIGLGEKLKAYNLQDLGSDTVEANLLLRHPADARSYGLATAMLVDLGLGGERGIRLLTNNPDKVSAVEGPNREVIVKERVAMIPLAWRTGGSRGIRSSEIENYLRTKVCVRFCYLMIY
jgi:GTP cyclohydrolase II